MKLRGQIFSGDLMVATLVFMAALSLAFFMWNSVSADILRAEEYGDMQKLSTSALEQLIRIEGVPTDWNIFNVKVPGLATEDRIINHTKASAFIDLMNSTNYENNLHLMGIAKYEFFMNVTDLNWDIITIEGKDFVAGEQPFEESSILTHYRTALYNDTIVRINFMIWR